MKTIIVAGAALALALMSSTAFAGSQRGYEPPKPSQPGTTVNQGGKGGSGVGIGIAGAKASSKATARSSSRSSATGGNASAYNGGNSVTFKDRLQAPGFAVDAGNSTAVCQGYLSLGGSFPGGGFGFSTSRDVRWCRDVWLANEYGKEFGRSVKRQYLIESDAKLRKILGTPRKP